MNRFIVGLIAVLYAGLACAQSVNPPPGGTVPNPFLQGQQAYTDVAGDTSADITTNAFLAGALQQLNPATSVQWATTAVLPNTPTYNNGTVGVGATLTSATNTALVIDSNSVLLADCELVKNQALAFQNGIYCETQLGDGSHPWILTRRSDYNSASNINQTGTVPVIGGTVNALTNWLLVSQIAAVGSPNSITYASQAMPAKGTVTTNIGALGVNEIILGNGGFTVTASASIPSSITATTQSPGDNSTKVATTKYVDAAVIASGALYVVPALSSFTQNNFSAGTGTTVATQTVTNGAILLSPISYQNACCILVTISYPTLTPPFKVRFQAAAYFSVQNSQILSLGLTNGTKYLDFEWLSQGPSGGATGYRITTWATYSSTPSVVATLTGGASFQSPAPGSIWVQVRDDSTNLYIDLSASGQNFYNVYVNSISALGLTPTAATFGGANVTASNPLFMAVELLNMQIYNDANLNGP